MERARLIQISEHRLVVTEEAMQRTRLRIEEESNDYNKRIMRMNQVESQSHIALVSSLLQRVLDDIHDESAAAELGAALA